MQHSHSARLHRFPCMKVKIISQENQRYHVGTIRVLALLFAFQLETHHVGTIIHDKFKRCIKLGRAHQSCVLVQKFMSICTARCFHTSSHTFALFIVDEMMLHLNIPLTSNCGQEVAEMGNHMPVLMLTDTPDTHHQLAMSYKALLGISLAICPCSC
jgi:hypothetical protein